MNTLAHEPTRWVLPQWLPLKVASGLRDFTSHGTNRHELKLGPERAAFLDAYEQFNLDRSPFVGAELLGVAFNLACLHEAKSIAEYVLSQPILGSAAHDLAQRILTPKPLVPISISSITDSNALIKKSKSWLQRFPLDSMSWVEAARLYTIRGQLKKAQEMMEVALKLAPENRYTLRCAVRFFVHSDQWERAYEIAFRASRLTSDPWILSLYLSTAGYLGKRTKGTQAHCRKAYESKSIHHVSEFLEACATNEIMTGSEKAAKKIFQRAWIDPARTVISHSQWVVREKLPHLAIPHALDYSQSPEAMAWVNLLKLDYEGSIQSSRQWILEEPYSTNSYLHASFVSSLLHRFDDAEIFAKQGLEANPKDEGLLNNLIFALSWQNKLTAAEELITPMINKTINGDDPVALATLGLLRMKQGRAEEGRKHYFRTFEIAAEKKDPRLGMRAIMNYLIIEAEYSKSINIEYIKQLIPFLSRTIDPCIIGVSEKLNSILDESSKTTLTNDVRMVIDDYKAALAKAKESLLFWVKSKGM